VEADGGRRWCWLRWYWTVAAPVETVVGQLLVDGHDLVFEQVGDPTR
jgi:hypothetical protein